MKFAKRAPKTSMKKTSNTINYQKCYSYVIHSPENILSRIKLNTEPCDQCSNEKGLIQVIQSGSIKEFQPSGKLKYLEIAPNTVESYPGYDYYRYGVYAKTIWRPCSDSFIIKTRTFCDEQTVLDCMRYLWYGRPASKSQVLLHASLVEVNGTGVLFVGPCRSGKTTLTVRSLFECKDIGFVSDGLTLLYNDSGIIGHYLPRAVYARFATFSQCDALGSSFLVNLSACDATQILDNATIARIVNNKRFDLDLGINMARTRFCQALSSHSLQHVKVSKIIFCKHNLSRRIKYKGLTAEQALPQLRKNEFPKHSRFGEIERQPEICPPKSSILSPKWLQDISIAEISFNDWESLTKDTIEYLLTI